MDNHATPTPVDRHDPVLDGYILSESRFAVRLFWAGLVIPVCLLLGTVLAMPFSYNEHNDANSGFDLLIIVSLLVVNLAFLFLPLLHPNRTFGTRGERNRYVRF